MQNIDEAVDEMMAEKNIKIDCFDPEDEKWKRVVMNTRKYSAKKPY